MKGHESIIFMSIHKRIKTNDALNPFREIGVICLTFPLTQPPEDEIFLTNAESMRAKKAKEDDVIHAY